MHRFGSYLLPHVANLQERFLTTMRVRFQPLSGSTGHNRQAWTRYLTKIDNADFEGAF